MIRGTIVALPVLAVADWLAPVLEFQWQTQNAAKFAVAEPVQILSIDRAYAVRSSVVPASVNGLAAVPELKPGPLGLEKKISLTLLTAWLVGALGLLYRDFRGRCAIRREARLSHSAATGVEGDWLCACEEFGLKQPPLIRVSPHERSPFLLAGRKTVLVIPASLAADDSRGRRLRVHVFRHEAAHVAGGDLHWLRGMRLCVRLLWFHPLVWALEKLHLSACEEAADAEAARRGGSKEYRGALAQMALKLLPVGSPATAFLRVPSVLKRLRDVGHHVTKRPPAGWAAWILSAVLLLIGFAVGNLGVKRAVAEDTPAYETVEAALAVKMGKIDFNGVRLTEAVGLLQLAVDGAVTGSEPFPLRIRLGEGVRGDAKVILKLDQSTFERVVEELARFAGGRHRVSGGEILIEADEANKITIGDVTAGWVEPIDIAKNAEAIEKVLKTTILPAVEFRDTTLKDALQFLSYKAEDLNSDRKLPFSFVVHPEAANAIDAPITLRLSNVPLGEALRYVTSLAKVKYAVTPSSILIRPIDYEAAELYVNSYRVPPTAFFSETGNADAKEVLKSAGIVFGDGAGAVFRPESSHLIVKNTRSQLELVEAWIDTWKQAAPVDPSDLWYRAYLSIKEGEIAESEGELVRALNVYEQAKSLLADVAAASPKFQPEIVSFRQTNIAERIAALRKKAGESANPEKEDLEDLLKKIVIPSVDFKDTTLKDALQILSSKADESNDGGGVSFSFVIAPEAENALDTQVTLRLSNVPLGVALRYLASLAQVKYAVEPHAIVIRPVERRDMDLYTNVFQLRAGVFKPGEGELFAKEVLENAGIVFGEGASVVFNPATLQLIVRNTQSQMELVEAWLESVSDPAALNSPAR